MTVNFNAIFAPRSVAIVGASPNPDKLGHVILDNLRTSGFPGHIYPINPKYDRIDHLPTYPDLTSLPEEVEHVIIVIPAAGVKAVVTACPPAGVKAITIISAGFGESSPQGKALEQEIAAFCHQHHISLIGPNVIGIINPQAHFNASWMQAVPQAGSIAFLSQSGALCCSLLDWAQAKNLKFAYFCSLGNKADVNELDLFRHWADDSQVSVLAGYLEEITNGRQFVFDFAKKCDKPIILLKAGQTQAGAAAVNSHTGSLAGAATTVSTALRQAGVIQSDNFHHFVNLLAAFSHVTHFPSSNQVTVITNAGGAGILALDALAQAGLHQAPLTQSIKEKLRAVLPAAASTAGPIDILGDADAARYQAVANIIGQTTENTLILFLLTPQFVTQPTQTAAVIADFAAANPEKTVVTVMLGQASVAEGKKYLLDHNCLVYDQIDDAVTVLAALTQYGRRARAQRAPAMPVAGGSQRLAAPAPTVSSSGVISDSTLTRLSALRSRVQAVIADRPVVLSEKLTHKLLAAINLDTPATALVHTLQEAQDFATRFPSVVLKAPNDAIAHKTDAHAVFPDLQNTADLQNAWEQLTAILHNWAPTNPAKTPLVIQEMIPAGVNVLVGINRDGAADVYQTNRGFGHLLVVGTGGIETEIYADTNTCLLPADRSELAATLQHTKVARLLSGFRGQPACSQAAILDNVERLAALVQAFPEIVSLDVNPLICSPTRAVAVDVKIFASH